MTEVAGADLAGLYRETRERLANLVGGLPADQLAAPVPACPGWTIRDVIAHLTATAEDAVAGRLTGPPSDEHTAGQVARLAEVPVPELLARWAAVAPRFEEIIAAFRVLPAVVDLASHEQDIRGAAGRAGARDSAAIRACTDALLTGLDVPVPLRVKTEDGDYLTGPAARADPASRPDPADHVDPASPATAGSATDPATAGPATAGSATDPATAGPATAGSATDPATAGSAGPPVLTLSTTRFEAFRWRMGRRSRAQLAAMNWSGDPSPVIDHLTVFGPASASIVE